MTKLSPYIRFNGNAKEAFAFYKECLGGELTITTIGESSMAQYMPDRKEQLFHAQLKNDKIVLLGSDLAPETGIIKGNAMVLTIICTEQEEGEKLFDKLSAGGKVGHKLEKLDFGTIGDFVDKFGMDWFLFIENKQKV